MSDLIKREDAINLCGKWRNRTNEHHDKNGWYIADTLLKAIKELPSTDRPQGEWVFRREFVEDKPFTGYRCSNCNYWKSMGAWNYCPNCGARMKGADDE